MTYFINSRTVTVTPEFAANLLDNYNVRNRTINRTRVTDLASDIKQGRFLLTHQGFARDRNGNLMDGQHRLEAVVLSGIAVAMIEYTYDIDMILPDGKVHPVMMVLDKGRPRSVSNNLGLGGMTQATQKAAICNVIAGLLQGVHVAKSKEHVVMFVYDLYRSNVDAMLSAGWGEKDRKSQVIGVLAMLHFFSPYKAEILSRKLSKGCDIREKTAEHALSRFIKDQLPKMTSGSLRGEAIDRLITGCMKYLGDEKVSALCSNIEAKQEFMDYHTEQRRLLAEFDQ